MINTVSLTNIIVDKAIHVAFDYNLKYKININEGAIVVQYRMGTLVELGISIEFSLIEFHLNQNYWGMEVEVIEEKLGQAAAQLKREWLAHMQVLAEEKTVYDRR